MVAPYPACYNSTWFGRNILRVPHKIITGGGGFGRGYHNNVRSDTSQLSMKDIASPRPRVPEGRRIYVIGDIHGRADLLDQLHELIVADAAANPELNHLAVYLGDYVDRGFESRQVIDGLDIIDTLASDLLLRPAEPIRTVV